MINDLNFKSILLDDKAMFDSFFTPQAVDASEYSFTNLFAWSLSREIRYKVINGILYLCACYENDHYLMQPFNSDDINSDLAHMLEQAGKYGIGYARRIGAAVAARLDPAIFTIQEDRDSFDYIYDSQQLALLKGRKLSNKRAHVKKFKEQYSFTYEAYTPALFDQVMELSEKWLERKGGKDDVSMYNEFLAISHLLKNFDHLNAEGAVLKIDNRVIAFAFGEQLSNSTYVIHFEKADTNYAGAYQAINQFFIKNEVHSKYQYVNREQDIGIEGIRKAKMSYHPLMMGKKYTAALK